MHKMIISAAVLFSILLIMSGCAEDSGPEGHTSKLGGAWHRPGYDQPYQNCTGCHGKSLQGGSGPSCYNCHSRTF